MITDAAPPPAQPAPTPRPKIRLGLRAGLALGTLPRPAATLAADIGVRWPFFSIGVEGRADLPVTADVDQGVQIRASILAASLVPCGHWRWFVGCALVSVGAIRAAGVSVDVPKESTGAYLAAGPRVGIKWPIPTLAQIALRLSGEALVTVQPWTAYRANDHATVWITPAFAGARSRYATGALAAARAFFHAAGSSAGTSRATTMPSRASLGRTSAR